MQDRPTADELLEAVEHFLDDLTTNLEGSRSFHARVAANAVRIVRRELAHEDDDLAAEWAGLDSLLGPESPPHSRAEMRNRIRERTGELCDRIRTEDGDDEFVRRTFSHVQAILRNKLRVSDPELLSRSQSV